MRFHKHDDELAAEYGCVISKIIYDIYRFRYPYPTSNLERKIGKYYVFDDSNWELSSAIDGKINSFYFSGIRYDFDVRWYMRYADEDDHNVEMTY